MWTRDVVQGVWEGRAAPTSLCEQILADLDVGVEYERLGPIYAVVGEMIEARTLAGLTQTDIARRMDTTQSVVARLEAARQMPSFDLLTRYAEAVGKRVEVRVV
jgi:DNA-binding XRE family transcriptional regulator